MVVYHKTHRNMGLSSCDREFHINDEGRLVPDPTPEEALFLSRYEGFEIQKERVVAEQKPEADHAQSSSKKKSRKNRKKGVKNG